MRALLARAAHSAGILLILGVILFPLYWMLAASLKTEAQLFQIPLSGSGPRRSPPMPPPSTTPASSMRCSTPSSSPSASWSAPPPPMA